MRARLRVGVALAITLLAVQPAAGQSRDLLVLGVLAYQRAEFAEAVPLISRGLVPAAESRDELWSYGLHALTEALLALDERELADTWLWWAFQVDPALQPDSMNFPPAVTEAMQQARESVTQLPPQSQWSVTQRRTWEVPAIGERQGSVVVNVDPGNVGLLVNAVSVAPGAVTRVPQGVRTVALNDSYGQPGGQLTVAVFPSVRLELNVTSVPVQIVGVFLNAVKGRDFNIASGLRAGPDRVELQERLGHDSFEITAVEIGDGEPAQVLVDVVLHRRNCEGTFTFVLAADTGEWRIYTVGLREGPVRYPNC